MQRLHDEGGGNGPRGRRRPVLHATQREHTEAANQREPTISRWCGQPDWVDDNLGLLQEATIK